MHRAVPTTVAVIGGVIPARNTAGFSREIHLPIRSASGWGSQQMALALSPCPQDENHDKPEFTIRASFR